MIIMIIMIIIMVIIMIIIIIIIIIIAIMIMMIKTITIAAVTKSTPFQPGDFSTGFTTGTNNRSLWNTIFYASNNLKFFKLFLLFIFYYANSHKQDLMHLLENIWEKTFRSIIFFRKFRFLIMHRYETYLPLSIHCGT